LAEYAARIPAQLKLKFLNQKYLLKEIAVKLRFSHEAVYGKKIGVQDP
jgi:hypothetical protein